jgi:hypothetical protein
MEHDAIIMPIAMIILGIIVKSFRLMMLPIMNVFISFLVSFLIM